MLVKALFRLCEGPVNLSGNVLPVCFHHERSAIRLNVDRQSAARRIAHPQDEWGNLRGPHEPHVRGLEMDSLGKRLKTS